MWPYAQKLTADVISPTTFGRSYKEGSCTFELQTKMVHHTAHLVDLSLSTICNFFEIPRIISLRFLAIDPSCLPKQIITVEECFLSMLLLPMMIIL